MTGYSLSYDIRVGAACANGFDGSASGADCAAARVSAATASVPAKPVIASRFLMLRLPHLRLELLAEQPRRKIAADDHPDTECRQLRVRQPQRLAGPQRQCRDAQSEGE